jgi:fatty acid desaturase
MKDKSNKKPRGTDIFQDAFWTGRYYLTNVVVYFLLSIGVLHWTNLFENVSLWWTLSLVPILLHSFRYIVSGTFILIAIATTSYWQELSSLYLIFLPAAIYFGHITAVFIHNAAHYNFKPIWLNPIVGELCALQQLSAGYPVFQYIHNQHHAYPDVPDKDPHPTRGYTFWRYIDVSRSLIQKRLTAIYFETHGESEHNKQLWKMQMILLLGARFAKAFFLFSLLGPKVFALLYLPSYLSNVFFFASFNYFTHVEQDDGSTEILNLENTAYFRVCNRILFGVMSHKNHHLRPGLFNPIKL